MLLADKVSDILGPINAPPGSEQFQNSPTQAISRYLSTGIRLFIIVSAVMMLLYLFLGAFDWIVSGGDKEKITKAQNKLTNAIIGIFLVIIVISVFGLIAGDILGIVVNVPGEGWQFNLPTIGP